MNEPLIVNENALADFFVPERLLHREEQITELKNRLSPILKNRSVENIFLTGTSGAGKTAIAKHVLRSHFREHSAYINCWKHRTTHEVLTEVLLSLQVPVHGRESTGDLSKVLERLMQKKKIIICLDEVDKLNDFDVLYLLARNGCGLILVSTRCHSLSSLNSRIRSSLALTEIEFPMYSVDELYNIMKDRIECAFRPGALKNELVRMASLAAQGDARTALEIVRKACKKAEVQGLNEISMKELREAIDDTSRFMIMHPLNRLNQHQKVLYEILEKKRKLPSGALYGEYSAVTADPVVDRAYRKYMNKMVNMGLVRTEGKGRWKSYEIVV
jgi:orc1/cdc6 family replication initiation protein